jgi:hypothetical protein
MILKSFAFSKYKSDFGMFCIVHVPNLSQTPYINELGHGANFVFLKLHIVRKKSET